MEIVKKCQKHGSLTLDQVIKAGKRHLKQEYKCKQCMKELHAKNYLKNKEKILARCRTYKEQDIEHYRNIKRTSRNKRYHERKQNDPDFKIKEEIRQKRFAAELQNHYIKKLIIGKKVRILTSKDIPQSLIDLKREQLKLFRKIKEKK